MTPRQPTETNAKSGSGYGPDQALLEQAVREAGQVALGFFGKKPSTRRKPDGTHVSEADLAVDRCLKEALTGARPDYGWLSEETEDDGSRREHARVWMVDPIDGTRAFLKEKREWSISAALVDAGRPVLGVVYNPATEEFFCAAKGAGTQLNGTPVSVQEPVRLENARLIASSGLFRHHIWERPWPPVERSWVNSVAYRMALVAAGRTDATLSLSRKHDWDLAAAELLVQEAGGQVTNHMGEAFLYNGEATLQRSLIAAGPSLHEALLERTRRARV